MARETGRGKNNARCDAMRIKQGTWSVLFGCHSIVHSLIVVIAWKKLYGRLPNGWQLGCILLHDIGHWGKDYLDNYEEKRQHAELGARIAGRLFGKKGYDFVSGHNAYVCEERSLLYTPDKYSWIIAPLWWMTTTIIFEPKLRRKGCTRRESAMMFREAMRQNMAKGWTKQGHDIYMQQWGHYARKAKGG